MCSIYRTVLLLLWVGVGVEQKLQWCVADVSFGLVDLHWPRTDENTGGTLMFHPDYQKKGKTRSFVGVASETAVSFTAWWNSQLNSCNNKCEADFYYVLLSFYWVLSDCPNHTRSPVTEVNSVIDSMVLMDYSRTNMRLFSFLCRANTVKPPFVVLLPGDSSAVRATRAVTVCFASAQSSTATGMKYSTKLQNSSSNQIICSRSAALKSCSLHLIQDRVFINRNQAFATVLRVEQRVGDRLKLLNLLVRSLGRSC